MPDCTCTSIGADSSVVTFHECHHVYKRGDKQLVSVSKILRETWPVKPSWDGVDEAVLENARDRGVQTDLLFSSYVNGTLTQIHAGTRNDSIERFLAMKAWWDSCDDWMSASSQVMLADEDIAGTADLIITGNRGVEIWDVKNTAQIETTYSLQLGGYVDLYEAQHALPVTRGGVIHVTQAKDKPVRVKAIPYDMAQAVKEWRVLREFWNLVRSKTRSA